MSFKTVLRSIYFSIFDDRGFDCILYQEAFSFLFDSGSIPPFFHHYAAHAI